MNIEINTRLYNDISQWCEANGFEPLKYIEKTLRERIATDKYGDLNEKVQKEPEPEVKKTKPTLKVKQPQSLIQDVPVVENKQTKPDIQDEDEQVAIDTTQEETQTVEKKKKRTLKAK